MAEIMETNMPHIMFLKQRGANYESFYYSNFWN